MKHLSANSRERPETMASVKLAELPAAAAGQFAGKDAITKKMIRRVRKGQASPVPA